jgi:hypothetical protein
MIQINVRSDQVAVNPDTRNAILPGTDTGNARVALNLH